MKKVHINLRIKPETLAHLRARAASENTDTSSIINSILDDAAQNTMTAADGYNILLPALKAELHTAITRAAEGLEKRLKHLLERALLHALAARLQNFQLLAIEFGGEQAQKIYEESTAEAKRRLEKEVAVI
jgi:hypothetical protein